MSRTRRGRWLFARVAVALLAVELMSTAPAGSDEHDPSLLPLVDELGLQSVGLSPSLQTPEVALAQDLSLNAAANGWTLDQALAHYRATEAVGQVAEQVAELRPDVFVGSVLSTTPGGTPALYVKGVADQMITSLVAEADIQITVVDNQPYSFEELEARKLVVHHGLEGIGFNNVSTGFSVTGAGDIVAGVTREAGLPDDPAEIVSLLPPEVRYSVTLTVNDAPIVVDEHAFGGMWLRDDGVNECTSGWSVYNTAGTTGVTGAGHCDGINQIDEPGGAVRTLTYQAEHRGQWGDIEWNTSTHSEPAQFYATATVIRRTNFLEPRGSISENESVCLYGRSSNNRQCLNVQNVSQSCTNSGVFNDRLVLMNGDVGIGGDSGSPWSFNNRAYGSHKGNCADVEGREVFSVADLYDEALGVRVRLSDTLPTKVTLHEEDKLVSTDGRFTAIMQNDGNFVIYQSGVGAIWATGTNSSSNTGARIIMQNDGNLVIYRTNNTAAWASSTFGSGHYLTMQTDGNLVMYRPGTGAVWASNTCCR